MFECTVATGISYGELVEVRASNTSYVVFNCANCRRARQPQFVWTSWYPRLPTPANSCWGLEA
jgi:hypothetical protein